MLSYLFNFNTKISEEDESKISIDEISYEDAVPIVKKTWKELMKNKSEVGETIFKHVVAKEISMSVLFLHSQLEQQSTLFMKMLDTVIGYLDDQKVFDKELLILGEIHNKQYGVKLKHYKHFRTAFMKAIKIYIPWNDRRENAWLWFWHRVIQMMAVSVQKNEPLVPLDVSPEKISEYIFAIHESFDTAMEKPVEFGGSFYNSLIHDQKDIAALFSKTEFKYQSARFISMLQHAVRLLDDQSTFQHKMRSLSYQHREYGVSMGQLEAFGEIFTNTLRSNNGDQWQHSHDQAWKWFWNVTIKLFRIGIEQNKYRGNDVIIKYNNRYFQSPNNDQKSDDEHKANNNTTTYTNNNSNNNVTNQNVETNTNLDNSNNNNSINNTNVNTNSNSTNVDSNNTPLQVLETSNKTSTDEITSNTSKQE